MNISIQPHRHNPQLLSLPQLISAKHKIGITAAFYNPTTSSLKSFLDVETMTATEFRQQLVKNLDITLTDEELGAIVMYLDSNGSKTVNTDEFVKEFFELGMVIIAQFISFYIIENSLLTSGRLEKNKIAYQHREEKKRREMRVKKWRMQKEEIFTKLTALEVDNKFTERDQNSALEKLAKVAFEYDKIKGRLDVKKRLQVMIVSLLC